MNPNEEQFDDFKVAEETPEMENMVYCKKLRWEYPICMSILNLWNHLPM